jgi:hypothetical protein
MNPQMLNLVAAVLLTVKYALDVLTMKPMVAASQLSYNQWLPDNLGVLP